MLICLLYFEIMDNKRRNFLKKLGVGGIVVGSIFIPDEVFAFPLKDKKIISSLNEIPEINSVEKTLKNLEQKNTIKKIHKKFKYAIKHIGYGNFNKANFNEVNKYAKFDSTEQKYLEKLFYTNASVFGFYGEKVINEIDYNISRKELDYIKGTGHFLREDITPRFNEMIDKALEYNKDLEIILTSGIRNIPKQMFLFLNKAKKVNYNLSLAAHSLAPPGCSFHGKCDFDVGRKGFGINNFTNKFAKTKEFEVLTKLGYLQLRYHKNNDLGVRYEPWHVKMS